MLAIIRQNGREICHSLCTDSSSRHCVASDTGIALLDLKEIFALTQALLVLEQRLEVLLLWVHVVYYAPTIIIQVAKTTVYFVRETLAQLTC